jgi:hypothetical protein
MITNINTNYCDQPDHTNNICNIICTDTGKLLCGLCLVQMYNENNANANIKILNITPVNTFVTTATYKCEELGKKLEIQLDRKKHTRDMQVIKMNNEIRELEEKIAFVKNVVFNSNPNEIINCAINNKSAIVSNILRSDVIDHNFITIINKPEMHLCPGEYKAKSREQLLILLRNDQRSVYSRVYDFVVVTSDVDQVIKTSFCAKTNTPVVLVGNEEIKITKCAKHYHSLLLNLLKSRKLLIDDGVITKCGGAECGDDKGYVLFVPVEYNVAS